MVGVLSRLSQNLVQVTDRLLLSVVVAAGVEAAKKRGLTGMAAAWVMPVRQACLGSAPG